MIAAACLCGDAGICSEHCAGELEVGRMAHPAGPCVLGFEGRCARCRRETHALARHRRVKARQVVRAF